MLGCIVALTIAIIYAFVMLYVFAHRVDASIFFVNILLFTVIASIVIYLAKKERENRRTQYV
jgi:membrane protein YdbS with pleckstrin-like domain